jgi:flavin reductase
MPGECESGPVLTQLDAAAVSKELFRDGMARLSAAVNIITTDGPAGRAGFTASAVCSVSDEPPTLLVCLNRSASVYDVFSGNAAICVNTLRPEHQELSRVFGGKTPMAERFQAASWKSGVSGAPVLEGASASFDCRIANVTAVGSHDILICEVVAIEQHQVASGLVYFDRRYHAL